METVYHQSLAYLNKFKVSLLHEEATEIESIDFIGLWNLTKGLYHAVININIEISMNANQNTDYRESIFLSKGNSKIWSNDQNDNLENLEG